jgi:hypothetical protein
MADNPLKKMVGQYKSMADEAKGAGEGIRQRNQMAQEAMHPSSPAPESAPVKRAPLSWEKAEGAPAPAGEKPAYKMAQDILANPKSYKDGGEVKKTGFAMVHKGEHVVTPEQKMHMKHAMGLANDVLGGDEAEPKKTVKEMRIRKGASGGHIVTHIHHHIMHPDEDHVTTGTDHLMDHVMHHMTDPDEGEEESMESPGVQAMEKAVGYEK